MNTLRSKKTRYQTALTRDIKPAPSHSLVSSIAFGLVTAIICCLLLLVAGSVVLYQTNDPDRFIKPSALTVLYCSSFMGGFVGTRRYGKAPLICGAVIAVSFLVITFAISLLLSPTASFDYNLPVSFALRGMVVVFSFLGAFAAAKTKKRKLHHRKNI